jgi:hypothetical protein
VKSRRTQDFKEAFARLPKPIQAKARRAFRHFKANPQHPSLQFKLIDREGEIYSARIDQDYRALTARQDDVWLWFWIGKHADYDKFIAQL